MEARHYTYASLGMKGKPAGGAINKNARRSGLAQRHGDVRDRLVEPVGKLVDEGLLQAGVQPVVEDKAQVGKGAGLQEKEAVEVVLMSTLGACEVIGLRGHPLFETVEQRFTDFAAALGATGFAQETFLGGEDAAIQDHFQAVDRFVVRQALGMVDHIACAGANGIGHAVAVAPTGAELLADDFPAHQPAQDRPGAWLMDGHGGDSRGDDALGVHGALGLVEKYGWPC